MLSNKLSNYQIILASGSPRRQRFFKELDIDFVIKVKSINEVYPSNLKKSEMSLPFGSNEAGSSMRCNP